MHDPSFIILDNARHHKYYSDKIRVISKLKKIPVLGTLDEYSVQYDDSISAVETKLLLWDYVRNNIDAEIVQPVLEMEHTVLLTPARYSDLQPIELVWVMIKSSIAAKYSYTTTFHDVRTRLEEEFKSLLTADGSETI